jgi:4-hydroxy-3-methylbut-2-en-1-yl diphosphate synthase IspG/GcpE
VSLDLQRVDTQLGDLDSRVKELEETVKILNVNLINQALVEQKKPEETPTLVGSRTVNWGAKKKELEKKYSSPAKTREALVKEITHSTDVLEEK